MKVRLCHILVSLIELGRSFSILLGVVLQPDSSQKYSRESKSYLFLPWFQLIGCKMDMSTL